MSWAGQDQRAMVIAHSPFRPRLAMHPSTYHLKTSYRLHSHLGAHGSLQSTAMCMSQADGRLLFTPTLNFLLRHARLPARLSASSFILDPITQLLFRSCSNPH